ncbi:hypothetical protein FRX31_018622 [Thalictrum thalictroides]|uniref:MORF/ORRM1/DAG-like MORF domain-containing protein n=1 Tax=Thalictrum thalictroides TaxID=46969 RepID=A0A7J6W4B4_THATH|nr:hypothetical protein FRX31_018622 [Thalictrum thalictroides]
MEAPTLTGVSMPDVYSNDDQPQRGHDTFLAAQPIDQCAYSVDEGDIWKELEPMLSDEVNDYCVKFLVEFVGSEEEAIKKLYLIWSNGYGPYGFCAEISKETSKKLQEHPNVLQLLQDNSFDIKEKDCEKHTGSWVTERERADPLNMDRSITEKLPHSGHANELELWSRSLERLPERGERREREIRGDGEHDSRSRERINNECDIKLHERSEEEHGGRCGRDRGNQQQERGEEKGIM